MSETEKLLREARKDVETVCSYLSCGASIAATQRRKERRDLLARIDAHLAKRDVVEVPREVINFLRGCGPLDGVWFGDKHPTERGNFWWRKYLNEKIEYDKKNRTLRAAQEGK